MTILKLQVRSHTDSEWGTLNQRDGGAHEVPRMIAELLHQRDGWRMTEFRNHSFRIVDGTGKELMVRGMYQKQREEAEDVEEVDVGNDPAESSACAGGSEDPSGTEES